ncbi:hypothetical protein ABT124_44490, partial [Streptomyces sp. NPDC001982]
MDAGRIGPRPWGTTGGYGTESHRPGKSHQAAEPAWLRGQITRIEARLARPLGAKADKRAGLPRGYGSRAEWHAKSRRLHLLRDRLGRLEADWAAGRVHVVRGGKPLAR